MKKALKWIGIIIGGLIVLIVVLVGGLYFMGRSRMAQAPQIQGQAINIPADEAAVARGQRLANYISLCKDCHGADFSGEIFVDESPIGVVAAPNLTGGQGGVGATNTPEDWERAIRHGVGHDGRTLAFMPSIAYAHMSDEDLGALIAYLKSVPPVDKQPPQRQLMVPGTIIFGVMAYSEMPVSLIDHNAAQSVSAPPEGVTAEYGDYLTKIGACIECHGANLAGRPADAEGPPPGPNLTPAGNPGSWSEEDFLTTIRNGITPEGKNLDPEMMPWPGYANMTDDELKAIWLHLSSLQSRSLGDN